jgi:hypothetical protein
MDTIQAVKLSRNISQFVAVADEFLSSIRDHGVLKENESPNRKTGELARTLHDSASKVRFTIPSGAPLLTDESRILLQPCQQCHGLSSELSIRLEKLQSGHLHGDPVSEEAASNDSSRKLSAVNDDMKNRLAPLLWSSIDHMIRDLAAKNSRLGANRTKDIDILQGHVDSVFRNVKSNEIEPSLKQEWWIRVVNLLEIYEDLSAEQDMLSDLQFWTMTQRQKLISKEHQHTFEWIFEEQKPNDGSNLDIKFVDWLTSDESIFWISGRPGSGKSTLMKFIVEHPNTLRGLKEWSGKDKMTTASFYFWSSAKDPLQKSGTGLLRSILYQILRECPELIRDTFADQWQSYRSGGSISRAGIAAATTSELLACYQRLADLLPTVQTRFCFFMDGLDEYQGDPADIIRLVELLSRSHNLKACISSRQWAAFEAQFGGANPWKLYVHDLTKSDMELYVRDLLERDSRFCDLAMDRKVETQGLIQKIVQSAEGVFLWVFLVVRSLLGEIIADTRLDTLHEKLAAIPSDLERYFESILFGIEDDFRQQTAHKFLITLQAVQTIPLMCYWFMDHGNVDDVTAMKHQSLSPDIAAERLRDAAKSLETQCKGLLKAFNPELEPSPDTEQQWLFEHRVDFLHRTVADYLLTADMQMFLRKWSSDSFNGDLVICRASLAMLKITPSQHIMFREPSRVPSILHLFFSHVKFLESAQPCDPYSLLLDDVISKLTKQNEDLDDIKGLLLGPGIYWSYQSSFEFSILYHCVSYSLERYVTSQLDSGRAAFPEPPSGLLSACLSWDPRVRPGKLTLNLETIQSLLRRKLDPNMQWGDRGFSFWQMLLTTAFSNYLKGAMTQTECDAIKTSIEHGADLQAHIDVYRGSRIGDTPAIDIVEKLLPKEQYHVALKG